jgi:hypothetical protein
MDKLPGHAYAPGFEPGWFDIVLSWEQGPGADNVMVLVLVGTLILLVLVRLVVSSPRLRNRGVRARHYALPANPAPRDADLARIVTRTLTDRNFAYQATLHRPGQGGEEAET